MKNPKGVLILTPFFSPNIGGVESHLDDLVLELNAHKIKSYVLTYSPLTTKSSYVSRETIGYCQIVRYKWFGYQLFPKLEKYPMLDFLYITPYLLIRSIFWLLSNKNKIDIIHSQGFNAAFIGNILAKTFHKKHLCSTHAIYENINGISRKLTVQVLKQTDHLLCLSQKSLIQLTQWGINHNKISLYKYWVNLNTFSPGDKTKKFTVLFVGRLIAKKGIKIILQCAKKIPSVNFIIAGNGPLEKYVSIFSSKYKNIEYLGAIPNYKLSEIYRRASIFCIASQYPEGFGRVSMEAVASGLPVIGSNLGSIPEALDNTVSILFKPTVINFTSTLKKLSLKSKQYLALKLNCRSYAENNFSASNFKIILKAYSQLLNTN